ILVELTGTRSVPLVFTRRCVHVACPAPLTCREGECVTCGADEPCPPRCATDADCPSSECADAHCLDGSCGTVPFDDRCPEGATCDPEDGCTTACTAEECDGEDDDCDGAIDEGV